MVDRRLLVSQMVNKAGGGEASPRHAAREPWLVDLGEKASDLIPTGAFTGLPGIANEDDEEVQAVARGIDEAVRAPADQIAEGGKKLQEQGGWRSFAVRRNSLDSTPGKAVECGWVESRGHRG